MARGAPQLRGAFVGGGWAHLRAPSLRFFPGARCFANQQADFLSPSEVHNLQRVETARKSWKQPKPGELEEIGRVANEEEARGDPDAVAVGAKVFRGTKEEHNRTFKWGVGSRFRAINENRFVPVHQPHPKEVMVKNEYYDSDNPNIVWETLNEAWEVYWYENEKLNAKPFPVKKFGVDRAKVEAELFYAELQDTGRFHEKTKIQAPQPGVFYDGRIQAWVCMFHRDGRPITRSFSSTKYGFEGAKSLAIAKQNDPINGVLPAHQGGGVPLKEKRKTPLYLRDHDTVEKVKELSKGGFLT